MSKRFLLAWELGGGLGHSVPLAQIAAPLLAAGHRVDIALRDVSTARAAFGPVFQHPGLQIWQSPLFLAQLRGVPETVSYAELLFRAGFLDAGRLLGPVRAWRALFGAVAPDLLLVDHAPTALLAARGLGLRTAAIGTGFFVPPALTPIPAFREWEPVDPRRVAAAEERALTTANTVLAELKAPPLPRLSDLLAVDEAFLLTWPELDHYPTRPAAVNVRYWSPLPSATQGQAAEWPDGDTPRVFAYLKGDYGPVDAILTALKTAPFRTLAHVPGLAPEVARRVSGGSLRIASGAVNMVEVGAQADAVLCNAGSGTVCTVLRHGIPSVLLPMHAEQYLFARRVEQIGAGVLLGEADARGKTVQAVQRILKEPVFRARARTFAQRHGADAQRDVAREVALRMEAMASG